MRHAPKGLAAPLTAIPVTAIPVTATLVATLVAAFLALAAAAAPARAQAPAPEPGGGDRLAVVASFSILGDLAARVGGERVAVASLVGRNGDAHVFAPSPADVRALRAARLVVINGLGLEGWMERLTRASATTARVVVASAGVVPRRAGGTAAGLDPDALDPNALDPHAWQSVRNAQIYVSNIRDGLILADPAGRPVYEANAAAYAQELARLDADIRRAVAAIVPVRRKVITTHDAFGYFGAEYGVAFIAAQGVSSEADPSARDLALIIRTIRAQHIPALFFEAAVDPRLVRGIAAETGARSGGTLYADTLSDAAGPAAGYADMMRHNTRTIADALR